jgi:hypothetical protein
MLSASIAGECELAFSLGSSFFFREWLAEQLSEWDRAVRHAMRLATLDHRNAKRQHEGPRCDLLSGPVIACISCNQIINNLCTFLGV